MCYAFKFYVAMIMIPLVTWISISVLFLICSFPSVELSYFSEVNVRTILILWYFE